MNNSVFCQGNCQLVSERIANYLNTGQQDQLTLPKLSERVKGRHVFPNGAGDSDDLFIRVAESAEQRNIHVSTISSNPSELISQLKEAGPGSHALVAGDYKPNKLSWATGHVFNIVNTETTGNKSSIHILDGYARDILNLPLTLQL